VGGRDGEQKKGTGGRVGDKSTRTDPEKNGGTNECRKKEQLKYARRTRKSCTRIGKETGKKKGTRGEE